MLLPQKRTLSQDELPLVMGGLAKSKREEFEWWQSIICGILDADGDRRTTIRRVVKQYGHMKGVTEKSLYRKCQQVADGGPIQLLDKRVVKKLLNITCGRGLPQAFIDFWHIHCMENQRKTAPAYRSLFWDHLRAKDQSGAWKIIPGYGTWRDVYAQQFPNCPIPEICPYLPYEFVPSGWSYQNLCAHQPNEYAMDHARVGRGKAKRNLPPVPTNRAGLEVCQYRLWDDMFIDMDVVLPGVNKRQMRPIQLGALDLFSGYYRHGVLCRQYDYMTDTRRSIREEDFLLFYCAQLRQVGYRKNGTCEIVEHATANVGSHIEKLVSLHTGGNITFERGGYLKTPFFKGMTEATPRGNPQVKAALESIHNLIHNETAALPGQIGKDWDNCPEKYYGEDKRARLLIPALAAVLSENPRLAAQMRLPFMNFSDFLAFNNKYIDRINARRHHHLQGFHEAGLTRCFFRLYSGAPWLPLDAHYAEAHGEMKNAIDAACANPENRRVLPMTPEEAYKQGRQTLIQYPAWGMPDLLPESCKTSASVKQNHTFAFERKELGTDGLEFYSLVTQQDGTQNILHHSSRNYICHLNPLNPNELFVSDPDGAFLGVAKQIQRHCRADNTAILANLGEIRHIEGELAKELRPYGRKLLQQHAEDSQANAEAMAAVSGKSPTKSPRAEECAEGPHAEFSVIDYLNRKNG